MKQRIPSLDEYINESKLVAHAERELQRAGMFDKDADYGGMLGKAVVELTETFSKQGHSGMSAHMVIELFNKIARWDVLTPITSDVDEWEDVTHYGDPDVPMWQNKRNPAYFSNDEGKTWWNVDDKKVDEGLTDMNPIDIAKLERYALGIAYVCAGEYGITYYNEDANHVFICLGDSHPFETDDLYYFMFDAIRRNWEVKENDFKIEIGNECGPNSNETGWKKFNGKKWISIN